jgi:uncharacterized protein (DUF342 family)
MAIKGPENGIRLIISPDNTRAELLIGPRALPDNVTIDEATSLLFECGIEPDNAIRERAKAIIDAWEEETEQLGVVVEGSSPKNGENGRIDWDKAIGEDESIADDAQGPESQAAQAAGADADEPKPPAKAEAQPVSFYDRCAFVFVKEGQRLGRVVPPTDGEDGLDVFGNAIAAKPGRAVSLRVDDSILLASDGEMTAQLDGVLSRSRDKASVKQYLELPQGVDFSTGNIDFDGDVKVINGVRDLFKVSATGNLEIAGLIECAQIQAGGDIVSAGGMAGREEGTLRAGGDLTIRYIDSTHVTVGGSLRIEREAINCEITVNGKIESPQASIIGGRTSCIGPIEVAALGSHGGTHTTVIVGCVPPLEEKLTQLDAIIARLESTKEKADEEMQKLKMPGRVASSADRSKPFCLRADSASFRGPQ